MRYTIDEDEKELVLHQKQSLEQIMLLQKKLAPVYPGISAWTIYVDTKAPESETSENAIPDLLIEPPLDTGGEDVDSLEP